MSQRGNWIEASHLGTLTALTGIVTLDPTAGMRGAPDWASWLTGQQRLDRVMSRVAPPLFLSAGGSAAAAALVALARRQNALAAGRAVCALCIAAAIAVTLTVNEPVNARLREWRPQDEPAEDWQLARARWNQAHAGRRVLLAAAALASFLGARRARRAGPEA
jgi:hypothetical protein